MLLCCRGGVLIGTQNLTAGVIFHHSAHQHGNVGGCAVMIRVIQTAGVGEVGVFQSQFFRLLVHQLNKLVLRAAQIDRDRRGRICTGRQRNAIHQIF